MVRPRRLPAPGPRRGIILLVVIALLTLFAVVGLSFVLYTQTEAAAARAYREAESPSRPDVDPELALAYFLGQLLYDVDDGAGVYSALRGHRLARLTYGLDDDPGAENATPFNGTGRLHGPSVFAPAAGAPAEAKDEWNLVNYTYFPADGFLRDPERLGWRAGPAAARGPFTGGFNVP